MTDQIELFVPDRFDQLQRRAPNQLDSIVVPVDQGLTHIKRVSREMSAAGRGSLLILRGDSGSGKSTFVSTLGHFLEDVETESIGADDDIAERIRSTGATFGRLRAIIIEGRDALKRTSPQAIEDALHIVNQFLRSKRGERTIVVWPSNTDDLEAMLIEAARRIGADALLGVEETSFKFSGPPRDQFIQIAEKTVATLNQGASLADFGISYERAAALAEQAATVGKFMGHVRNESLKGQAFVQELLAKEQCRLWVVVIAGNDPEGDVAGLTRGTLSAIDIERLCSATEANVVKELKRFPDKLGILGTVLDAKILHLPMMTAMSMVRDYASSALRQKMTDEGLSKAKAKDALERLSGGDFERAFSQQPMGTRTRGSKPGPNTVAAFEKVCGIANSNDALVNRAIGDALVAGGLLSRYELEQDFGTGLKRRTDILGETAGGAGPVRIEVMWRKAASRALIANYVLLKLFNYGRALGFLDGGG